MNKRYSTIIIDDEAPARLGLLNLLKEFPETFDVIDIAQNGTEAQQKIEALNPDIIFLDIEMPGCTGFELLARFKARPMVIFCTAYDQYSLEAFETNSIDYLVKPVKLERIGKTVQKLKNFHIKSSSDELLKVLQEITSKRTKKDDIYHGKKMIKYFYKLDEVSYFEADSNYTSSIQQWERF
jgi:DNA-binding LytR/AlgR family response regulator